MNKIKCDNFKDAKGNQYYLGDIVLNPCINDIWVVGEFTEQEIKDWEEDTKFCLMLNNSKDDYVIAINEPEGFTILKHCWEDGYESMIEELNNIAKQRQQN